MKIGKLYKISLVYEDTQFMLYLPHKIWVKEHQKWLLYDEICLKEKTIIIMYLGKENHPDDFNESWKIFYKDQIYIIGTSGNINIYSWEEIG